MAFKLSFPTLERIAFINISISVWKNNFYYKDWPATADGNEVIQWTELEANICTKIDKLPIVNSLKRELRSEFFYHIGEELKNCVIRLDLYLPFDHPILELIVKQTEWTIHGKINAIASVKSMLRSDELPIHFKFGFACIFCFEDEVRELWQQLPNDERLIGGDDCENVYFWKSVIFEVIDVHRMSVGDKVQNYCSDFMDAGGVSGAEFFFGACSEDEKLEFVMGVMSSGREDAQILFYLLSRLNERQLQCVFSSTKSPVIPSLAASDWVYAEFLENTFIRTRQFFTKRDIEWLLSVITNGHPRCDVFQRCFEFVWCNCPPELKNSMLRSSRKMYNLLKRLYKVQSFGDIKLCLRDVCVERREQLVKDFVKFDLKNKHLDLVSLIKKMFGI